MNKEKWGGERRWADRDEHGISQALQTSSGCFLSVKGLYDIMIGFNFINHTLYFINLEL